MVGEGEYSKAAVIRKCPCTGSALVHCLTQVRGDKGEPNPTIFPFLPPWMIGEEERAGKFVLSVSKYKILEYCIVLGSIQEKRTIHW
jgi:hypothetical protein